MDTTGKPLVTTLLTLLELWMVCYKSDKSDNNKKDLLFILFYVLHHQIFKKCLYKSTYLLAFTVSECPSLGGTYSGLEPMGLLWSLRPVPGSKPGLR